MLIEFEDDGGDPLNWGLPVRLVIAGVDLLLDAPAEPGGPPRHGLPLLVHEIAPSGMLSIRYAWYTGTATVRLDEYGDSLLVRVGAGSALIHPTQHRHGWEWSPSVTVQVPYPVLLAAWRGFADRVRLLMIQRHPEAPEAERWRYLDADPPWIWRAREKSRLAAAHASCFDSVTAAEA